MRLPRIHCPTLLQVGHTLDLPAEAARHLVQVLRLGPGRELVLFDGSGREFHSRLTAVGRRGATAEVYAAGEPEPALPLNLHLNLGISKGPRMDTAIQKAVELGVSAITPLIGGFSQVRLEGERMERRVEHWRGVMIAACEQSGRSRIPALHEPVTLEGRLAADALAGVLLEPDAPRALPDLARPEGEFQLFVGPEGGWSPDELILAYRYGIQPVRLGPRVLRTETAPLAAIAAMQTLWGDFR